MHISGRFTVAPHIFARVDAFKDDYKATSESLRTACDRGQFSLAQTPLTMLQADTMDLGWPSFAAISKPVR